MEKTDFIKYMTGLLAATQFRCDEQEWHIDRSLNVKFSYKRAYITPRIPDPDFAWDQSAFEEMHKRLWTASCRFSEVIDRELDRQTLIAVCILVAEMVEEIEIVFRGGDNEVLNIALDLCWRFSGQLVEISKV
jgi:hypothetical protein